MHTIQPRELQAIYNKLVDYTRNCPIRKLPYFPAYKHMCLYQGQLRFCNFSSLKSDGYKHMCLCPVIIKNSILETCYSMINRLNKTQVSKLNI